MHPRVWLILHEVYEKFNRNNQLKVEVINCHNNSSNISHGCVFVPCLCDTRPGCVPIFACQLTMQSPRHLCCLGLVFSAIAVILSSKKLHFLFGPNLFLTKLICAGIRIYRSQVHRCQKWDFKNQHTFLCSRFFLILSPSYL